MSDNENSLSEESKCPRTIYIYIYLIVVLIVAFKKKKKIYILYRTLIPITDDARNTSAKTYGLIELLIDREIIHAHAQLKIKIK